MNQCIKKGEGKPLLFDMHAVFVTGFHELESGLESEPELPESEPLSEPPEPWAGVAVGVGLSDGVGVGVGVGLEDCVGVGVVSASGPTILAPG